MKQVITLFTFLCLFWANNNLLYSQDEQSINIAVSASFTGEASDAGLSFKRAANLAIEQINAEGGINGRTLVADFFDDQNIPKKGRAVAGEIVNGDYHAVIGHHYSNVSLATGGIYKEAGIPVISPASTADGVTVGNDWYFRAIFSNDAQASFIANYINQVFNGNEIKIITGNVEYGIGLRNSLISTAKSLDLRTEELALIDPSIDTYSEDIKQVTRQLKNSNYNGVIFLAMHASIGVDVVKTLRDHDVKNTIFVPDAFASESFLNGLRNEVLSQKSLQFYTRNIFVASPLIFDSANQDAQIFFDEYSKQFKSNPDWRAAYTYDSVLLLKKAMENSVLSGNSDLIGERLAIKEALTSINSPENGVNGITGLNYFNKNGDAVKPVAIGNFSNYGISSALTQFTTVPTISEIYNLDQALTDDSIVKFGDTYMYRTDVVFTGIKPRKIKDFDPSDGVFTMEFDLWMRHQGNNNVTSIEFVNANQDISLSEPIYTFNDRDYNYDLFRLTGSFRTNFSSEPPPFRHYYLGTSLRHKKLDRNKLIYVSDLQGMGFLEEKPVTEQFQDAQIIPQSNWQPSRINSFSDVNKISTNGRPEYILSSSSLIPYSTFNYIIDVQPDAVTVRGMLPDSLLGYLFIASVIGLLLLVFFYKRMSKLANSLLSIFVMLLFLMSGDQLFTDQMVGVLDLKYIYINEMVFDILWWLLPSIMLIAFIEWFLWATIEEKTERKLPSLIRGITILIIITFASFGIIAFVFEQRLTSLLATSGLAAMIIGLALQVNLSHIFSGLALNIERPFRVGDYIKVGDNIGRVTEINWRTTRIFTALENTISLPNALVTEQLVENFNYPVDRHFAGFTIYIHPAHPPEKVIALLTQAVYSTEGFMDHWVVFNDYTDWAAKYYCYGAISNYSTHFQRKSDLLTSVRRVLKRNNISLAVKRQEIKMIDENSDLKTILK